MDDDGELRSIKIINDILAPDYFCVTPYNSINGEWVSKCFNIIAGGDIAKLKFQVTKEILCPWRRAYQTVYFYSELRPFKNYLKLIDSAIIAYYQDNWLCSYITLIPVIEAVIDRWGEIDIPNYPKCEAKKLVCETRWGEN